MNDGVSERNLGHVSDGSFWGTVWPSLRIAGPLALLILGMIGMLCELDFLVDPAGPQQTKDMPPSTGETIVIIVFYFLVCALGVWLLARTARRLPS